MHVSTRPKTLLIAAIFLTPGATSPRQPGQVMSTTHGRVEFLLPGAPCCYSLLFFPPFGDSKSIFPRAATLALLILHHVLVPREQMPLEDRRVFSVVMISVAGTSRTKQAPIRETTSFTIFPTAKLLPRFRELLALWMATSFGKSQAPRSISRCWR